MPHIHDLPDEILLHILTQQYLPDASMDLMNVAVSSRRLLPIALTQLYKVIRIVPRYYETDFVADLSRFIACLLNFPERVSWVESASFGWLKADRTIPQKLETIFELLTNLRGLCLTGSDPHRITRNQNNTILRALLRTPASLSLRTISISQPEITLEDIQSLYALPAIENLTINFRHHNSSGESEANARPQPSRLRSLHFKDCSLPSSSIIRSLLQGHSLLQVFSWSELWTSFPELLTPQTLFESISYLSGTLTSLELSGGNRRQTHSNDGTFIDLHKYNVLETLVIDAQFLFTSFPTQKDPSIKSSQPTDDSDLILRLPISLKNLQIWFDVRESAFKSPSTGRMNCKWIELIAKHKVERFPKFSFLKIVEWERCGALNPEGVTVPEIDTNASFTPGRLQTLFKSANIELELRPRRRYR